MWPKSYRDYKPEDPLIKEQVRPNRGIIGCEMHDQNGWGDMSLPDDSTQRKPGWWVRLRKLFGPKESSS